MPIVHVQMLAGRPRETKRRLLAELTRATADVLEVPAERVRVLVSEIDPELWGVGGRSLAEGRGEE